MEELFQQNSLILALIFFFIGSLALWSMLRSNYRLLNKNERVILLLLRLLAIVLVSIAIWNPYKVSSLPDPQAFRVIVLADASESMQTRDTDGNVTRTQYMEDLLTGSNGILANISKSTDNLQAIAFSSENSFETISLPLNGDHLPTLPGTSSLSSVLDLMLEEENRGIKEPIGGILLLSDGIHNSGPFPYEAAQALSQKSIPVSTVSIGSDEPPSDVSISLSKETLDIEENKSEEVTVILDNPSPKEMSGSVEVRYENQNLFEQVVQLAPFSKESILVKLEAPVGQHALLQARFNPSSEDWNESNNLKFTLVNKIQDEAISVLMLSSGASWELRSIRQYLSNSRQIKLTSIVKLSSDKFLYTELDPESENPQLNLKHNYEDSLNLNLAFLMSFDCIILDLATLEGYSEILRTALIEYTESKSGGILLTTSDLPENKHMNIPEKYEGLFPAGSIQAINSKTDSEEVSVKRIPLFEEQESSPLLDYPSIVPDRSRKLVLSATSIASQTPLKWGENDDSLLAIHNYGSGRVAVLASTFFWKWRMSEGKDPARYNDMLEALMSWLTTSSKSRIESELQNARINKSKSFPISVAISDPDYGPSQTAEVRARVTFPDGLIENLQLFPSGVEPGIYSANIDFHQSGAHSAIIEATFPDGSTVSQPLFFMTEANRLETASTTPNPELLRDIARLTNGRYYNMGEEKLNSFELPLSASIPLKTDRNHWTRTLPFILSLMIIVATEWWLRRRWGLN